MSKWVIQVTPIISFIREERNFPPGDKLIHNLYSRHLRKNGTQQAARLAVEFQTHHLTKRTNSVRLTWPPGLSFSICKTEVLPATPQGSTEHQHRLCNRVRALLNSQNYCEDQNELTEEWYLVAPWPASSPPPQSLPLLSRSLCRH